MAKKTQRRAAARHEREQLGCMWGFMNMFNFRHGPLAHKLLTDQKHVTGNSRNNESKYNHKDAKETHVGEERNVTIAIIKPSVKKLIAEELFIDKEIKRQRENAEAGQLSDSEVEGIRRKNQRRKHKIRKQSCDNFSHMNIPDTEEPEIRRRNQKNHGSTRSLDIDNMIEEFYSEIHRKSTKNGIMNHKQADHKEKLRELVKFLISQKLLHGNRPRENSEILTSKDLMEVFQILGSDEELFLKLLQDPEILVPREDTSNASEQSTVSDKKWSSFFKRKETPQDMSDEREVSDRIFILKPRSASFSSPETGTSRGSSPDSHLMRNKVQNERNSSNFFLSEIKRKLKHAIRKEQPGLKPEGYPKTKDHFFVERMTKPSTSQRKPQKVLQEFNEDDKKKRVSNIYVEAKKHLSEMLNNGGLDSNSKTREIQKSLGRILSLPEYLSPLSSPVRRWEPSSTAHRKCASADFINLVNIKKESHVYQQKDVVENTDSQVCNLSKASDNCIDPTASEPTENSLNIEDGTCIEDKTTSADDEIIIKQVDIIPEDTGSASLCDQSSLSIAKTDEIVDDLSKIEASDEQIDSRMPQQTSNEDSQPSPSQSLAKTEEGKLGTTADFPEWSSPVSVLEPLLMEDDISPARMRTHPDEAEVQPWCIQFDEKDYEAKKGENGVKNSTSDKELVFKYVKAVLDAVDSDCKELYLKAQFSDQLLEPALISNIPFNPNRLCPDHELLFDCINEVLMELCCCPPWAAFVKPPIRVFSSVKSIIHEVQEAVYWHLLPLPLPHALDQIVRKDLAKSGNWLDIRCDLDCIGFEISELILQDLLEELRTEYTLVAKELKTDESSLSIA